MCIHQNSPRNLRNLKTRSRSETKTFRNIYQVAHYDYERYRKKKTETQIMNNEEPKPQKSDD